MKGKCDWKGILSDMEEHFDVCGYVAVACTNEGCDVTCIRKALDKHRLKCDYGITNCSFKGCGKGMLLHELTDHKEQCQFRDFHPPNHGQTYSHIKRVSDLLELLLNAVVIIFRYN